MPLRKCIALHLVMAVHLAAVIAQSDLSFTGREKKTCFFSDEMVSHFTPHFTASSPDSNGKNNMAPSSICYSEMCTVFSKRNYPPSSKRKLSQKGKCGSTLQFQLSCLIIPSGSRISSSRNHSISGPSKQKISWILHSLGATCRG